MKNSLLKKIWLLPTLLLLLFSACGRREVDGIRIGDTLYAQQNRQQNRELCILIEQNLEGEPAALCRLSEFDCGDGAACYDLGWVLTQIIYRRGETAFAETVRKAGPAKMPRLKSLLRAGLEYGDHNADGKPDERLIETEFPRLDSLLTD